MVDLRFSHKNNQKKGVSYFCSGPIALKEVGKALGNGTVKVPSTVEELESFLNEYDYHVDGVQY